MEEEVGDLDIRAQVRVKLATPIKGSDLVDAFNKLIALHNWKPRSMQIVSGDENLFAFGSTTDNEMIEIAIGVGERALPEINTESLYGIIWIRSFNFSSRADVNFVHSNFSVVCWQIAKELEDYLLAH